LQNANDLENKYNDASEKLEAKYNETQDAKMRADDLKAKAATLYQNTYQRVQELLSMESEFDRNEQTLTSLRAQIDELNRQMALQLTSCQEAARFLRTCGTA